MQEQPGAHRQPCQSGPSQSAPAASDSKTDPNINRTEVLMTVRNAHGTAQMPVSSKDHHSSPQLANETNIDAHSESWSSDYVNCDCSECHKSCDASINQPNAPDDNQWADHLQDIQDFLHDSSSSWTPVVEGLALTERAQTRAAVAATVAACVAALPA